MNSKQLTKNTKQQANEIKLLQIDVYGGVTEKKVNVRVRGMKMARVVETEMARVIKKKKVKAVVTVFQTTECLMTIADGAISLIPQKRLLKNV